MTSQWATDAVRIDQEIPRFLRVDKEDKPVQGQLAQKQLVITATTTIPTSCPNHLILSSGSVITLTSTDLRNLVGREVTISSDATNATQHVITLPANSINNTSRTVTFNANAGASVTFLFIKTATGFSAIVKSLYQAVIS